MRLTMLGLNHRTAPIELREHLALDDDALATLLARFRRDHPAAECVPLSTCNRTELYVAAPSPPVERDLIERLAATAGIESARVADAVVRAHQHDAVRHLFRVSAGLDSMVLGETQILGQVKRAYESAIEHGTVGPVMHRVFQRAIATAKRCRTQTRLDAGRVSVASVAIDFARQVFEDFASKTVLGIGAGEMGKAALRRLGELRPGRVWLTNRSPARAAELAERLRLPPDRCAARPWDQLDDLLVEADIVIVSTAAAEPTLTAARLRALERRRQRRPMLIIDLGLPRNVEPAVGDLPEVYLYNLDDLQSVATDAAAQRQDRAAACEAIIDEAAHACLRQVQHHEVGRLIRELRHRLHAIGRHEQARTDRKAAATLSPHEQDAVRELVREHTHRVVNKILHLPLSRIDDRADDLPLGFYTDALRALFQIDANEPAATDPPNEPEADRHRESHAPAETDADPASPGALRATR